MGLMFVATAVFNKVFLNGRLVASVGNRWLLKWTSLIITEQGESCLASLCVSVHSHVSVCETDLRSAQFGQLCSGFANKKKQNKKQQLGELGNSV